LLNNGLIKNSNEATTPHKDKHGNSNVNAGNTNNNNNHSHLQELIVIHVFDENRKVNKDFSCEKELLVGHMKYFEKYLTEATSVDDIDISVHCDIKIFEWLMKYLKHKEIVRNGG